jgi:TonB family protein
MKTSGRNVLVAVALVLAMSIGCLRADAQSSAPSEAKRQAKHLMTPQYPELARKLNLSGSVRIEVTIGQDGTVKRTRVLGGHPLLAAAAQEAAQKSAFEPGPKDTIEIIEFKF